MLTQPAFHVVHDDARSSPWWRLNQGGKAGKIKKIAQHVARLAVRSLYTELALYPKPGLVSLRDQGSHRDMDAACFMRSLFSLRHYFKAITLAGAHGAGFDELKALGIKAERRMLVATGNINTHRGAIFALGMLCAAAGYCLQQDQFVSVANLRAGLHSQWGPALGAHSMLLPDNDQLSHGQQVAHQYAASGAREEAAAGFPSIFDIALPHLQNSLQGSGDIYLAQVDTFFSLMAHISDTNLYHRGGSGGFNFAQAAAQEFLLQGGTVNPQWWQLAEHYHQQFILRRLSPGGAADMLAATCFVHEVCKDHLLSKKTE